MAYRTSPQSFFDGYLEKDKFPKINILIEKLKHDSDNGGDWIFENRKQIKSLHDLTHGGGLHINFRTNEHSIEPNYPNSEIINLIKFVSEISIRVGVTILTIFNDENGMQALANKAEKIRFSFNE